MPNSRYLLLMLGLCLGACRTPAAPAVEENAPPACIVQLSIEREDKGGFWFLHATAVNQTKETMKLPLHDRCPGGAVDFQGLGEGYDYYGTCTMGACGPREDPIVELPPGVPVRLATAVVSPKGGACQAALTEASYSLSFTLPLKTPLEGICRTELSLPRPAP